MLIVCPNCATSYQVDAASLGAAGRSVRCVRCRNVWFARDPGALAAIAQTHRAEVEALTAGTSMPPQPDIQWPADDPPPAEHGLAAGPAEAPGFEPGQPAAAGEWPPHAPLPHVQDPSRLADAPALAPPETGAAPPAASAPGEDIETAARRAERTERGPRWARAALPLAILALIALDAALIAWRADVVRAAPQTASLYAAIGLPVNLRGLTFADVATATETHDGVQVLVVEGTIASVSARAVEVPRLRVAVRNARGQEIYAWTALPTRSVLGPGESMPFRSRLASPPPDSHDVLVRFFSRRDLVAGVR